MSRVIHKFPLQIANDQTIKMPGEIVKPLHVGEQNGVLCLWARVDQEKESFPHRVRILGTGHVWPLGLSAENYVGTVQMQSGLVWHVFVDT